MRRSTSISALAVLAVAIAAPAGAADAPIEAPDADTPVATVKLARCGPAAHEASFYARMQTAPGVARMGLRFTLLERTGADGFKPVKAPELARWQRSKPGVAAFGYRQTVRNLPANAAHKVRVSYRWYAADGSILHHAVRRSAACRQFLALPNLTARLLGAWTTNVGGVLRYSVRVSNTGRAPVAAVPVRLSVDGDVLDTVTVASLPPGERKLLSFRGPACSRSVRAEADPDGVIVESSEGDNASELACAELPRL